MDMLKGEDHLVCSILMTSISLNLMIFLYCLCPVAIQFLRDKHTLSEIKKVNKIFTSTKDTSMRKQANQQNAHDKKFAKGIVNIVMCFALFTLGLIITTSTYIIYAPYFYFDNLIAISISLLISLCIFNLTYGLLYIKLSTKNIHIIFKLVISLMLFVTVYIEAENSIMVVIALFMCASVLTNELKLLLSYNEELKMKNIFRLVLLMDIFVSFVCNLIIPSMFLITSIVSSPQSIFNMSNISITMFFVSTMFFFFHNAWVLRLITYNAMAEISLSKTMKRKHSESPAVIDLGLQGYTRRSYLKNPKNTLVRFTSITSGTTQISTVGSLSSIDEESSIKRNCCNEACEWTEIDLSNEV